MKCIACWLERIIIIYFATGKLGLDICPKEETLESGNLFSGS